MQAYASGIWQNLITSIPHPNKIIFPQGPDKGITRGQLADYYACVAPYVIVHGGQRNLTVKRWPNGITGQMFYQKYVAPGQPIMINCPRDVVWWVGQGVIEWHAPLGTLPSPNFHDWAVMDLDPSVESEWVEVVEVARVVQGLLEGLEIPFLLKTSGQRGLHFYIAITSSPHDLIVQWMGRLAKLVVQIIPNVATVARLKVQRGRRVYLDYLQNGHTRTMAMPYTVRAVAEASVSTPIRPGELDIDPVQWTMPIVCDRLAQYGDLFAWQGERVDLPKKLMSKGVLASTN